MYYVLVFSGKSNDRATDVTLYTFDTECKALEFVRTTNENAEDKYWDYAVLTEPKIKVSSWNSIRN